jgi:hypothetical protein
MARSECCYLYKSDGSDVEPDGSALIFALLNPVRNNGPDQNVPICTGQIGSVVDPDGSVLIFALLNPDSGVQNYTYKHIKSKEISCF